MNVEVASGFRGAAFILALGARSAAAGGTTYVVDPARSEVAIHVGRAGLLKFAGHEHVVLAPRLEGKFRPTRATSADRVSAWSWTPLP